LDAFTRTIRKSEEFSPVRVVLGKIPVHLFGVPEVKIYFLFTDPVAIGYSWQLAQLFKA
jgi:hypothetical protein